MGRKNLIPYRPLTAATASSPPISPPEATSLRDDLATLFRALSERASVEEEFGRNMFKWATSHPLTASWPRENLSIKHQSALGNSPAHQLFDRVVVKLKDKVKAEKRSTPVVYRQIRGFSINCEGLSKSV